MVFRFLRNLQQLVTLLAHFFFYKKQERELNSWKIVAEILEVEPSWLYRFTIGFDVGNEIQIIQEKKDKKQELREDKVNALGLFLRKQYVSWK